jgi:uncharacterized protein (TIGR02266 family)
MSDMKTRQQQLDEEHKEHLRQHQRVAVEIEVSMSSENNFYAGITNNVSEGGVFIATYTPPAKGSVVDIQLKLPNTPEMFPVRGVVMWIRDIDAADIGDGTPPGVGLRWTEISPQALQAITKFVASRDTMLVDVDDVA